VREVGKLLIFLGGVTIVVGVLVLLASRIPWLGRLPGDVVVRRGPVTFYFPVVTSIVVSIVLTILLNIFLRR
jgi:DUF2905 family protein